MKQGREDAVQNSSLDGTTEESHAWFIKLFINENEMFREYAKTKSIFLKTFYDRQLRYSPRVTCPRVKTFKILPNKVFYKLSTLFYILSFE